MSRKYVTCCDTEKKSLVCLFAVFLQLHRRQEVSSSSRVSLRLKLQQQKLRGQSVTNIRQQTEKKKRGRRMFPTRGGKNLQLKVLQHLQDQHEHMQQ